MERPKRLLVSGPVMGAMLVMLLGCRTLGIGEPIVCTAQFVYGLNVTVLDQSTAGAIAADATMTLREDAYEEVVTDSWDEATLSGAGERPGGRALPRGLGCPLNARHSSPVRRGGVRRTKEIPLLPGGPPLRDRPLFGERTDLVSGDLELAAQPLHVVLLLMRS